MVRFLGEALRLNERAADDIFSSWISPCRYESPANVEKSFKVFVLKEPLGGNKVSGICLALLCDC